MIMKNYLGALSLALLASGGMLLSAPSARADADPAKEVSTAAQHAGLAAKAADLKGTQMHLHHVVNCLVGPSGQGFDGSMGNPCKDLGGGAITDTKDAKQASALRDALAKANSGLALTDMAAAQKTATDVQAMLTPKM
jgi:hypothetical protein